MWYKKEGCPMKARSSKVKMMALTLEVAGNSFGVPSVTSRDVAFRATLSCGGRGMGKSVTAAHVRHGQRYIMQCVIAVQPYV